MPRRRRRLSRIRHYPRRARRYFSRFRHRDKRMPLSVGVGLATSLLAPAAPGWSSTLAAVQAGDMPGAAGGFIRSWTGIYGIDGKEPFGINLMAALNPFDFSDAPAWKATLWSSLTMRLIKKFTHVDPISKVPVINKFVKFA